MATTFLDNARSVLDEAKMARLELLNRKSADFDTNSDEDNELISLKQMVKKLVAEKDREKNLQFLKDGEYNLMDIIKVVNPKKESLNIGEIFTALALTKAEITKAMKTAFPAQATTATEAIATYKVGDKDLSFKMGERIDKELKKAIVAGGIKGFVKHLTKPFGVDFMAKSHIPENGPYATKTVYDNIGTVATKLGFKTSELKKELGIK